MLDEYYSERGWDKETGIPHANTLEGLGLVKAARDILTLS
jgi:aldehyde:ferredoxin oxidoreductase